MKSKILNNAKHLDLDRKNQASQVYNILKAMYSSGGYELIQFKHSNNHIYFKFKFHGIKPCMVIPPFNCRFDYVNVHYNIITFSCALSLDHADEFIEYESKYLKP